MKTLNLNKLTILLGLFLVSVLFTTGANAECATTGTKITIDTTDAGEPVNNQEGDGLGDSCEQTPDSYKMTFYKIGLCTADTSFNDLSSCQYIVNDAAGVTNDVAYPSVGEMAIPKFAIDNGTYPYLVVLMTNKLGIKHSFESELLIPDNFFLVPEFVISAPNKIKASAGFDAIAQALESLVSKKSNDQSVEYASKSLRVSINSSTGISSLSLCKQ